jgi:hypothetical protein
VSERKKLSRCDTAFLRSLVSELNNSFRDHTQTGNEQPLEILARKLSVKQIDNVVKFYLLCIDAKEVAKKVKEDGVHEISKVVSAQEMTSREATTQ